MALGVTRARVLSARGDHESAEAAARSALPSGGGTGQVFMATFAYEALGDVLRAAGRNDEAQLAFEDALRLHERKGNVLAAEHVRRTLESLSD